jgi:hypothetical protein
MTMAETPQLKTIWTKCVDDNATGYATFQSNNQKVISNGHGYFMSYIRSRNEPYTAQQWRLIWSRDGGRTWRTLHEATDPTNPPVLETDEADTIYLIRPHWDKPTWSEDQSYLYRFFARDDYAKPVITPIPNSVHGKYAAMIDLRRRQLYFFSANEWFFVIGLDGKVRHAARLMQPGEHAWLQYPLLSLASDGTLYASWTTQKKDVYLYWDIHAMKSTDGGLTWRKLDGTPLALPLAPDESGPTDRITLDDEFDVHTWLSNMLVKAGKLHFFYESQRSPQAQERYVRYDLRSAKPDVDLTPRFGGETLGINRLDGCFAADASRPDSPLYCVGNDATTVDRLTCLVSRDNGATWHDYAVSRRRFLGLYAIGGCREVTRDGCIIGCATDQSRQPPRVYFFKIRAEGGR